MGESKLVGVVFDLDRRIAGLAIEALTRHTAEFEIDGRDATVKHDLADEEFASVFERGVLGDLPGEGRGVELAAAADEVTEAVSILVSVVEAVGEVVREWPGLPIWERRPLRNSMASMFAASRGALKPRFAANPFSM
jgi:hypothetical protein